MKRNSEKGFLSQQLNHVELIQSTDTLKAAIINIADSAVLLCTAFHCLVFQQVTLLFWFSLTLIELIFRARRSKNPKYVFSTKRWTDPLRE